MKKYILIGLVILVAAVIAFQLIKSKLAGEAYLTFETAMNKIVGPDTKWQAQSHDFSLLKKTLTVSDIQVTFIPEVTGLEKPLLLTVREINIKNGLMKAGLDKLMGLTDWKAQPETDIAGQLTLSDIKSRLEGSALAVDLAVGQADLSDVKLLAADEQNSTGPLGFLKSLTFSVGRLTDSSLIIKATKEEVQTIVLSAESFSLTEPRLSPELQSLAGPFQLVQLYRSLAFKEMKINNYGLTSNSGQTDVLLRIGQSLETASDGRGKIGHYSLENITFTVTFPADDKNNKVDLTCELFAFDNLDTARLMDKLTPQFYLFYRSILQGESPFTAENFGQFYNAYKSAASLFSAPYDLDSLSVANFKVAYNDVLSLGLNKVSMTGPFKAYQIPLTKSSEIQAFVNLPTEVLESPYDILLKTYTFGQQLGQSDFQITYNSKSSYDRKTEVYKIQTAKTEVKDLFSLDFSLELEKLSQSTVDQLAEVPLSDFEAITQIPEAMDIILRKMSLSFVDNSFTNKSINLVAQKADRSAEDIRQLAAMGFWSYIIDRFSNLENRDEVIEAGQKFLENPGRINLGLEPLGNFTGEFALTVYQPGNNAVLLNLLNIYLGTNSQEPIKLSWDTTEFPFSFESEDLQNSQPAEDDDDY
ncbi:MAG: hypothetical protein LBP22_07340 [Deltaproteobacteria bacterium]|jgi:hypothetical protein|nr:hypothetical protein [Deltaproteobacteria bacterium]